MAVPCTPSSVPGPMRCGNVFGTASDGGAALATTLASIGPRNLIILSTVGCPFFDDTIEISSSLGNAIQNIGGMRYTLNSLTSVAGTCRYSLVTANDGQHQFLGSNAALSANQFGDQGQLGAIHGYLAVNKGGLYDVAGQDQMINGKTSLVGSVDYTFEHIASDFRSAWPSANTLGEWLAYHDISEQLLSDPQVNISGEHMYDVRYLYTDPTTANKIAGVIDFRLAPKATNPVTPSTWDTATAAEFSTARATILAELQQVQSATGYLTGSDNNGGVRGELNGKQGDILADAPVDRFGGLHAARSAEFDRPWTHPICHLRQLGIQRTVQVVRVGLQCREFWRAKHQHDGQPPHRRRPDVDMGREHPCRRCHRHLPGQPARCARPRDDRSLVNAVDNFSEPDVHGPKQQDPSARAALRNWTEHSADDAHQQRPFPRDAGWRGPRQKSYDNQHTQRPCRSSARTRARIGPQRIVHHRAF